MSCRSAVATKKLRKSVARDAILTGKRYNAKEGLADGIVDQVVAGDNVLAKAIEFAASIADKGRDKKALGSLKQEMYGRVLHKLKEGGYA